jgi:hypothetical protein
MHSVPPRQEDLKNAIALLSGDQNGALPLSAPGMRRAADPSSLCTQSPALPMTLDMGDGRVGMLL